ncbi:MAG: rhomboid family intramembrane serine protease, partial [Candidatus Binatia bacterium]
YGWIPEQFFRAVQQGGVPPLLALLVSMFLHGSWLHLLGNLLYLYIFGGNVEDRLGHLRYVVFYCVGGIVATLVQTYATQWSSSPMIGASGAIAAVAGAYVVFFPTARVWTLIPLVISFRVVRVPAVVYLFLWLVVQGIAAFYLVSLDHPGQGEVAWWAHAGGFVAGLTLGPLFLLRSRRSKRARIHSQIVFDLPRSAWR